MLCAEQEGESSTGQSEKPYTQLARLVRRVHGGAGWDRTTDVNDYNVLVIRSACCDAVVLVSRRAASRES